MAAVMTPAKTRFYPSRVDAAIANAVATACVQATPVVLDGVVLGLAGRDVAQPDRVRWKPLPQRLGFDSYSDLTNEITRGKFYEAWVRKDSSGFTANGRWADMWCCAGSPAAGGYTGTSDTARQIDNTTTGAMFIGPAPSGGDTKHLIGWDLGLDTGSATTRFTGFLYDRVLTYDNGLISNASRNMTNGVSPQRYAANGQEGLQVMITGQPSAATGATASNLTTLTYTDNAGNAGQTVPTPETIPWFASSYTANTTTPAPILTPYDTGAGQAWSPFLGLAAGDSGVQKIENYQSSAANTGDVCFALVKPLAQFYTDGLGPRVRVDLAQTIVGAMERVYDTAALCMTITLAASTGRVINGMLRFAWS